MLHMRQEEPLILQSARVGPFILRCRCTGSDPSSVARDFSLYCDTSNLNMYVVGRPATYVAQVLFSLFSTTSALPTASPDLKQTTGFSLNATLGLDNETLFRSPNGIPGSPETSTFHVSLPYPVPHTAITLDFTHFDFPIPVVRALSTIYDARQEVLSHPASISEDATKNKVFEYSTRSSPPAPCVCSVAVQSMEVLGYHGYK